MVAMTRDPEGPDRPDVPAPGEETTAALLSRVRSGDRTARDDLARRYLPKLRAWARGQVPPGARDLEDTDDLVQVTLLNALDKVEGFEPRREGAFLAYLRRALRNRIRDALRRTSRRGSKEEVVDHIPSSAPSPLEEAIGAERLRAYEIALDRLPESQREAVVLRVELGFTYPEMAAALGSPSPDAARMMAVRGLARLAEIMDEC
jgi:RNA polymerase sigma-70 factor (ECF subfamily)